MTNEKLIFSSIEEAVLELKEFNKSFSYKYNDYDKETIIKKSVASSVFRAFRNLREKPSTIIREWLNMQFDLLIKKSKGITSQKHFDSMLEDLTKSLLKYWNEKIDDSDLKLGYGPASKIINLIFKMTQESNNYRLARLQKYLHVPFDEFSLKPLQNIINDLTKIDYKITIPQNPSMSFITTPELYRIMTRAVKSLCRKAEIHPIIYDYWSWNDKH